MTSTLLISPTSRQGGFKLAITGAGSFLFFLLLLTVNILPFNIYTLFIACIPAIALLLGVMKLCSPMYTYRIDHIGLIVLHRRGMLKIPWAQVQRIDKVLISGKESAFLGIKLKQIEPIIKLSDLPVFTATLIEQRSLLVFCLSQQSQYIDRFEDMVLNPEPYKGKVVLKGLQGMFAHHLNAFATLLGFHILLPINTFDRDITEFKILLKETLEKSKESA